MRDFARSHDSRVQKQLDRLAALSLPQGRLGLETMTALLELLGNPQRSLAPVFHVAGTNGKGSVCAFLRAILEAQGYRVHATTSPHLVRYNERIRVAGALIEDARLAELLRDVLDAGEALAPSFFEVTIAAAFTEFARVEADACVIEVGLGGRFDATNVLTSDVLAACGIAALGIDHERFLLAPEEGVPLEPMARIAFEKAGIAKPGVPLVSLPQPPLESAEIARAAERAGAPLSIVEPLGAAHLGLEGAHQRANAALAIGMIDAQRELAVNEAAIRKGLAKARWPARLHRLGPGPLGSRREIWLDGGHNRSAGEALAHHFEGQKLHLVIGMLANKDPRALIAPLGPMLASISAVALPDHESHGAEAFGPSARPAENVEAALDRLPDDGLPVLIAGSLYLAGDVLRRNRELPD